MYKCIWSVQNEKVSNVLDLDFNILLVANNIQMSIYNLDMYFT